MFKVIIPDCVSPPLVLEEQILGGMAKFECLMARSADALRGRMSEADAVLIYHEAAIDAALVDELKRCRVIVRGGVGYDNVDIRAAGAKGIPVCNVPDYGVDEVADHAIGMMLALHRGIMVAERRLRRTLVPWDRSAIPIVPRLGELTLGIIGCGRIGSATAQRAKALKMRVLVCDPNLRPGMDKALGVTWVDLPSLLAESDLISLHTPLTEQTRHLIRAETLRQMKPTVLLVNTARGAVVDIDALSEALRERRIGGAAIDVLPTEPPHAEMSLMKLWQEDHDPPINLIITPHVAYYSEAGTVEMRRKGCEEIARVLRGEPPRNCVNADWLARGV